MRDIQQIVGASRRWATIAVVVAVMIALPFRVAFLAPASTEVSDETITMAVESQLLLTDEVPSHIVDVSASEGVVTLSGTVHNILSRERAEKVAQTVKGVRSVVNKIEVEPVERTDEEIARDVRDALLFDPATDSYEVEVSVTDGTVRLTGTVDSWQEQQLAETVALGVRGVRAVENNVGITYEMERTDAEIKNDVRARLESDVWVDEATVNVAVENGEVNLSGAVGSAAERRRAMSDAWVMGTQAVSGDELEVRWVATNEMERTEPHAQRSDEEIEAALNDAFQYDPRVSEFDIETYVDGGSVTLLGVVDNLKAKKAAENTAENTRGVWRVKNLIKVRPEGTITDAELEDRVQNALERDPFVELFELEVDAANGIVHLDGRVNTSFEKERAEYVTWGVEGVVEVLNTVGYSHKWEPKDDWQLILDVESELFWSAFVEHQQVNVEVNDGVVILTGEVDTWHERSVAEKEAYEAGARDVKNKLKVKSGYNVPYLGRL